LVFAKLIIEKLIAVDKDNFISEMINIGKAITQQLEYFLTLQITISSNIALIATNIFSKTPINLQIESNTMLQFHYCLFIIKRGRYSF
jgi:hypothetical protein